MKRNLALLLVLLILTGTAAAEYVGVAPGVKDLGVVERGDSRQVEVYLLTDVGDPFTVSPSFTRPGPSVITNENAGYNFEPENVSQEDISEWVDFQKSSYAVDPSSETVIPLADGSSANVQGSFEFFLEVPEDAEPGYHVGAININPDLSGQGPSAGAAVQTLGLTQFIFVFRVPGQAVRDAKIMDVNVLREGEDKARIDYVLKNNGTVTIRLNRAESKIYDDFGRPSGKFVTGGEYLAPGESKVIQNYWRGQNVSEGEFRVESELNYLTGGAFIDETLNVPGVPVTIEDTGDEDGEGLPVWPLLMLIVLLAALMYFFEIDPVWIIMAVGLVSISGFVLATGLPSWIIGILIFITAVMVWYGW